MTSSIMVLFLPFYGESRQFHINFKKLEIITILIKGGGGKFRRGPNIPKGSSTNFLASRISFFNYAVIVLFGSKNKK